MTFKDKEYAQEVWKPDKITILESGWEEQRDGWYKLLSSLIPSNSDNILDVGCGVGMYYDLLAPKCRHYVGIDPVKDMIERAKTRRPDGDWRVGSVYNLPFPNNHFDLVFCWSVLVHLPHKTISRAVNELWRITKKALLFNIYETLDDPNFSVTGPWGEYLTAMDRFWVKKTLRSLNPNTHETKTYEDVDLLGRKKFQRKIFILKKD